MSEVAARPVVTLCANATAGVGGQGADLAHMIDAYAGWADLVVHSRGPEASPAVAEPRLLREVRRLPGLRRRRDWWTLASDLQLDGATAGLVTRRHAGGRGVVQGAVGSCAWTLAAARRAGARTILDCVNHHIDDLREHVEGSCRRMGVRPFLSPTMIARVRREYAEADAIRVMSARSRDSFLERGVAPARVFVARPPLDVDACPVASFQAPVFRVMFVGLLEPWKGFDLAIEAFTRAAIPDSELVLWGGPGSRAASRLLARALVGPARIVVRPESVHAVGFAASYGQANVLLHPALTDGFGLVVAEAMGCGLPVIVGENVGAAELVTEGESGFLAPPDDVDLLAARLRELAASPGKVRAIGAAAREAARGLRGDEFRARMRAAASGG